MFDEEHELTAVGTLEEYVAESVGLGMPETYEESMAWYQEMTGKDRVTISKWLHPLDRYAKFSDQYVYHEGIFRDVAYVVSDRCFVESLPIWKHRKTGQFYVQTDRLW